MTAPTRPFLTARWLHLAMVSYEIDPAALADRVPPGTVLDSHAGRTFVSVVGFQFQDTRVRGWAVPFHRTFDEVNLRFYVRRDVGAEQRRGVVFIKEIVPRRAIAWVARRVYNENYVALPMSHRDQLAAATQPHIAYRWTFAGQPNELEVAVERTPYMAAADSEEAFITEHYWGYVRQRSGATMEYQVEHPRWRVWRGVDARLICDVERLYGGAMARYLTGEPSSAFVAEGSQISVGRGRLIAE